MSTVALAAKSHNMKIRETPQDAVKEKENRRRSLSAFTQHPNTSFDQPKRRSFTGNRRSFSYSFRHHNNSGTTNRSCSETSSHPNVNTSSNNNNNDGSSSSNNATAEKVSQGTRSSTNKSRPSSRFFSSPQFSSSTPNLSPKVTKYIDSELKVSHRSVQLNGITFYIPTIVYKCCDFIRKNEPVEGLFRMNGSIKQVNLIESELQKNIDTCEFANDPATTVHDVAVVLKRWISKLDDGLITADVCNSLTQVQKEFSLSDYPSEFEDEEEEEHLYLEAEDSLDNIDEKLINMDQSFNLTDSPTKSTKSSSKSTKSDAKSINSTKKTSKDIPTPVDAAAVAKQKDETVLDSCYASSLIKLPIENLHLLLYLLHFLHYLAQPEISNITKMHTSNLAKVFQLNFFKSVDLTIGTKSFSTEDLKTSYLMNEELLTSMIQDVDVIIKDLILFLNENKDQMDRLLNVKTQQKAPNSVFVKKRKGSTASTKTNNTNSSNSRNASIDSNAHGSNSRAHELSTTLESCEEKESTPVPVHSTEGAKLEDLEKLEKSNEDKDVIRTPNKSESEAEITTDLNHHHVAHSDRQKDTRGHAIAKRDSVKRKSFFGFFSKLKQTQPQSNSTTTEISHTNNDDHTPSVTPKKQPLPGQVSNNRYPAAGPENASQSEPTLNSNRQVHINEETAGSEEKAISSKDELPKAGTGNLSSQENVETEEKSEEVKSADMKAKAPVRPTISSTAPATATNTNATATTATATTVNGKSNEIIEKLQQLDPSEEDKQTTHVANKREKTKSSKGNHEKSGQKRFSLFKFRRSS